MACATVRALAKVKPSAMTSRQPSVPNLIAVIEGTRKYTRSDMSAKRPDWTPVGSSLLGLPRCYSLQSDIDRSTSGQAERVLPGLPTSRFHRLRRDHRGSSGGAPSPCYRSFASFCSSSHFTILPPSWERGRGRKKRG